MADTAPFNQTSLSELLNEYQECLEALEGSLDHAPGRPVPTDPLRGEKILHLLAARHNVQQKLSQDESLLGPELVRMVELDNRLYKKRLEISSYLQTIRLADSIPAAQGAAWYWFSETPSPRYEWVLELLAFLLILILIPASYIIASRLLNGAPDFWRKLLAVMQALFSGSVIFSAVSNGGRTVIVRAIRSLKLPAYQWQYARLAILVLVSAVLAALWLWMPALARRYNDAGLAEKSSGRMLSAIGHFKNAINLQPEYPVPHFHLGVIYEDFHQYDQAVQEYQYAAQGRLDGAYNNLSRLYILQKDYPSALQMIREGLAVIEDSGSTDGGDHFEVTYSLYKNLGWARFEQGRYADAAAALDHAIELKSDGGAAYCLRAQVNEKRGSSASALSDWNNCLAYASPTTPEMDEWIGMAQDRVGKGTGSQ